MMSSMGPWLTRIIPELLNPMKAINKPIPAGMACLMVEGSAFTIMVRSPDMVRIINNTPEIKTMASACCQLYPMVNTIVNTKKALPKDYFLVLLNGFVKFKLVKQ